MKCVILHESRGRMRVHIVKKYLSEEEADILCYGLSAQEGITDVTCYECTGDAVITYTAKRADVLHMLARFSFQDAENIAAVPETTPRHLNHELKEKLVLTVIERAANQLFYPRPLKVALTVLRSYKHFVAAADAIRRRKTEVSILDATAIGVSILRGDYDTASSVMFLLHIGEILEEWTHKKSVDDLARTMALNVDKVWVAGASGEVLLPLDEVKENDTIIVRTGGMIPVDGKVLSGEGEVNQASMTGESMPVHKSAGSYVYAGTVMETGELTVCVDKMPGRGKYDRIVHMIEESEKLQSNAQARATHLADSLVPYSLGGTLLVYLLTRNVTRALAVLMVDFSCALKLAIPITVLSAMREAGSYDITIKGGRFLESIAEADMIVFDKTGTLTHAVPRVAKVIPFDGQDADEMLRLAACLEEHYPHSMANAVVKAAEEEGLIHEERHSKVEYVVAHGIASTIDGKRAVIGSYHFVFEDEKCILKEKDEARFANLPSEYSHLFLAIGGVLSAVICIEDPLRKEAGFVIRRLKRIGLHTVMMTGDNRLTAKAVAAEVGVGRFFAEVLPEEKAGFIAEEQRKGHKIIMIGDGINDSVALSYADCGIAISDGAAIAREVADVTIAADDLYALLILKEIADRSMRRIENNYRFIMSFNFMLILLGVFGILMPTTTALLHNTSTITISLHDMTELLDKEHR